MGGAGGHVDEALKTAPLRAAPLKTAPRKTAPAKTTPLKTVPLKIAPLTIPDDPRPLDRSRLQRAAGDTPGRPTSRGILLPCCPLPQRGGRLTGDFGVHSSVFRWKVGDISGPSSRIRARVSNNQWEVLDDQYFSRFGKWPSGQRDRPEIRGRLADPGSNPRHRSFFCPNGLRFQRRCARVTRPFRAPDESSPGRPLSGCCWGPRHSLSPTQRGGAGR